MKEPRYKYGIDEDGKNILIGDAVHRDLFARAPNNERNLELVKQMVYYANKGHKTEMEAKP